MLSRVPPSRPLPPHMTLIFGESGSDVASPQKPSVSRRLSFSAHKALAPPPPPASFFPFSSFFFYFFITFSFFFYFFLSFIFFLIFSFKARFEQNTEETEKNPQTNEVQWILQKGQRRKCVTEKKAASLACWRDAGLPRRAAGSQLLVTWAVSCLELQFLQGAGGK